MVCKSKWRGRWIIVKGTAVGESVLATQPNNQQPPHKAFSSIGMLKFLKNRQEPQLPTKTWSQLKKFFHNTSIFVKEN